MVKNQPANVRDTDSISGSGGSSGEKKQQPTPIFLLGKSHGQRSLVATVHGVIRVGYDLATKQQQQ